MDELNQQQFLISWSVSRQEAGCSKLFDTFVVLRHSHHMVIGCP